MENLSALWEEANLGEQRQILLTMPGAVYVDARKEKAVIAIRPKPAFKAFSRLLPPAKEVV